MFIKGGEAHAPNIGPVGFCFAGLFVVVAFLVRERGEVRLEGETSLSNKTYRDDVAPIILDLFYLLF